MTTAIWFAPAPSTADTTRLTLDFGLRSSDLYFRELVVPGLGGVWFVRQLAWATGAIALKHEMSQLGGHVPTATRISHGIEALACKRDYLDGNTDSPMVLGKRAFGRDPDGTIIDFERLTQRAYYVVNTHRQDTSRALRENNGLGLASGSRFNQFSLTGAGQALADTFLDQTVGQGGGRLRRWLQDWIRDRAKFTNSVSKALVPSHPSAGEAEHVSSRLLGVAGSDGDKRRALASALGRSKELPDIEAVVAPRLRSKGHARQALEVIAALRFGAAMDQTREVAAHITRQLEPETSGLPCSRISRDTQAKRALSALRLACKKFVVSSDAAAIGERDSLRFADEVLGATDAEVIASIVRRVPDLLSLVDGSACHGPLFRVIGASESTQRDGDDEQTAARADRTFRIAKLHALLRDIDRARRQ